LLPTRGVRSIVSGKPSQIRDGLGLAVEDCRDAERLVKTSLQIGGFLCNHAGVYLSISFTTFRLSPPVVSRASTPRYASTVRTLFLYPKYLRMMGQYLEHNQHNLNRAARRLDPHGRRQERRACVLCLEDLEKTRQNVFTEHLQSCVPSGARDYMH